MYPIRKLKINQQSRSERFPRVPDPLPYLRNASRHQFIFPRAQVESPSPRKILFIDNFKDPIGGVPTATGLIA